MDIGLSFQVQCTARAKWLLGSGQQFLAYKLAFSQSDYSTAGIPEDPGAYSGARQSPSGPSLPPFALTTCPLISPLGVKNLYRVYVTHVFVVKR